MNPISRERASGYHGFLMLVCLLLSACGGADSGTADTTSADAQGTVDAQRYRRPRTGTTTTTTTTSTTSTNASTASSALTALPTGFVQCAGEWSATTCNFTGTTLLAYGANGSYMTASVRGPFDCSTGNAVIGDPVPGVAKACYVSAAALSSVATAPTTTTTTTTTSPTTTTTTTPSTTNGSTATSPATAVNSGTSGVQGSVSFTSTTADIPNPDRGFYGWAGNDFVNGYDSGSVQSAYNAGQRLVMAKIQLDAYRSTDLPDSFLTTLNSRLASVRSAGMKAVPLFNYDFGASGNDASPAQIKRHLEQLKPVLEANADVIPFMRAGFIGAWGEWHSSASGSSCIGTNAGKVSCASADANRAIVRDALLANVPATTQIGFRYPSDLMKWYPSATQQNRAGMHNDCFQAGPTDSFTYTNTSQRTYIQALTDNTAFGGENCNNAETPLRNTCADILSEGKAYHLSWLNASDWSGFISAWKNGGCYAEVSRSMGYRLQLDALSHDTQVTKGGSLAVNVDLRNVGWARVFSERKLVVTLKHKTSGATISGSAGNLRNLSPQASSSTRVSVGVAIPAGAQAGDYDVYVSAPDIFTSTAGNPKFSVRFANADNASSAQTWDAGSGMFKTGSSVTIN